MPRSRIAGALFVLAGIAVVISSFLDWAKVTYQGQDVGTIVGRSINYGTGGVLAIIGLIVIARGMFRGAKVVLWVIALLNAAWTAILFAALQQSSNDALSQVLGGFTGLTASYTIAIGFIVLIVGAVLALLGAVVGATAARVIAGPAPAPAPYAPPPAPAQ